jgi:hypothetical protein
MLKLVETINNSGSYSDTYSVYENPDKEMVEKIKSLDVDLKISNGGFGIDNMIWKYHAKQDNGKITLISDDGDFSSITKKSYEEKKKVALLRYINDNFNLGDVFNKYVLPINVDNSTIYGHNPHYLDYGDFSSYNGVNPQFISESFETTVYIPTYQSTGYIKFENYIGYPITAIHLQADGSIINRDYNINFNKTDDIDREKTLQMFWDEIDKHVPEKIERSKGGSVYFIDGKYAISIYYDDDHKDRIELQFTPYASGRNYYENRNSNNKKVKPADSKIVVVDRQELKDKLAKKISEFIVTDEKIDVAVKEFLKTKNQETIFSVKK